MNQFPEAMKHFLEPPVSQFLSNKFKNVPLVWFKSVEESSIIPATVHVFSSPLVESVESVFESASIVTSTAVLKWARSETSCQVTPTS